MNPFLSPFKNPFGGLIAGGLSRPCFTDLVFWYNQKKLLDDLTGLKDKSTTKTHQAQPAGSVEFRGAQYATLASAVTLVGDFTIKASGIADTALDQRAILGNTSTSDHVFRIFNGVNVQSATIAGVPTAFAVVIPNLTEFNLTLTRVGDQLTLTNTVNDSTQTETCSTGDMVLDCIGARATINDIYLGNLWNITASDTTSGTLLDITMSYGADANIISTVGPDATLVNGLTSDRVESALYGDDSFNDDGWSESVTDNVELVTNGDFADWTADDPDDWTVLGESGSDPMVTEVTGGCRLFSSGVSVSMYQVILTTGAEYQITLNVESITDGNYKIGSTLGAADIYTGLSVGLNTKTFTALGTVLSVQRASGGGDDIVISSVSVQKITQGKIPADPDNPSQDIYGNALTYPGRASKDANVYGWTIPWDGVAYATLDEAVTSVGDFGIEIPFNVSDLVSDQRAFLTSADGDSYVRLLPAVYVSISGTAYAFTSLIATIDTDSLLSLERDGNLLTCTLNNVSETKEVSTDNFIIEHLATRTAGLDIFTGTINYIKLYNASNQLTNHWPIEGRNNVDDEQITIYDVVGGNHATVVSGTVPLFTSPFGGDAGSYVENLITWSEPAELAEIDTKGNVTVATATGDLASFVDNAIVFGDNSALRYAYQPVDNSANTRLFSVYVEMDDGLAPVPDQLATAGDFTVIMNGSSSLTSLVSITQISGALYKITYTRSSVDTNAYYGIVKQTTQSARGFKASRYHLTEDDGSYIRTDATAIPLTLIPSGGSYLAEKGGLTGVVDGVELWSSVGALVGANVSRDADTFTVDTSGSANDNRIGMSSAGLGASDIQFTVNIEATTGRITTWTGSGYTDIPDNSVGIKTFTSTAISNTGYIKAEVAGTIISDISMQLITQDIIPYGGSTEPNTFNGVFDAPADVFQVEQVEATLAVQEADATSIWIDKTTGATKLVDPADLVTIADYAFVGNGAITLYSDDITGTCLNKTNKYHGL